MKQTISHILSAADNLRRHSLPAAAAVLLAACSQPDALPGGSEDGTPVRFEAAVPKVLPAAASATRTTIGDDGRTVWTAADRIGIFMTGPGGSIPAALPGGQNVAYKVDPATGTLTPAGTPIYYPMTDDAVDFVAYAPFVPGFGQEGALTMRTPLLCDQTTPEKQAAMDLLFSDNARGIRRGNGSVTLRFHHLLAKIRFDITLGDGLADGNVTKVALYNTPISGTFAADGTVESAEGPDAQQPLSALRLAAPGADADVVYTALVIPGFTKGCTLVITVNGDDYTATISAADPYQDGRQYVYPVTVQRRGITVGTATIAPWEVGIHETDDARFVYTVSYDANGGTGTFPSVEVPEDTTVTLPTSSELTPPEGKIFLGWSTAADTSGDFFRGGEAFSPVRNTTLYAVWSGDGSSEDAPLLIYDERGLAAIADAPAKHYRLMKDIDVSEWISVCGEDNPFTGSFDGMGHTVTIHSAQTRKYMGLFGALKAARIRRVCVAGEIEDSFSEIRAVGGIAGSIGDGCVIENCLVTANFAVTGAELFVGGIYGQDADSETTSIVRNCLVRGNISNYSGAGMGGGIGGVAGRAYARIINCVVLSPKLISSNSDEFCFPVRISHSDKNWNNYAVPRIDRGEVWKDHRWAPDLNGRDGEDCEPVPSGGWWTQPGNWRIDDESAAWDFETIWRFDSDGYPCLRVVKP